MQSSSKQLIEVQAAVKTFDRRAGRTSGKSMKPAFAATAPFSTPSPLVTLSLRQPSASAFGNAFEQLQQSGGEWTLLQRSGVAVDEIAEGEMVGSHQDPLLLQPVLMRDGDGLEESCMMAEPSQQDHSRIAGDPLMVTVCGVCAHVTAISVLFNIFSVLMGRMSLLMMKQGRVEISPRSASKIKI